MTVVAKGTAPFTYQWYKGTRGITTTPVGTNSPSYTTPALTATTSYWVKVSNAANLTGAKSITATVTVTKAVAPAVASIANSVAIFDQGSSKDDHLISQKSFSGICHDGGLNYRMITVIKSSTALKAHLTVEVSSNLLDWHSGKNYTTVVLDNSEQLVVRDNTPCRIGSKRYIRINKTIE